MREGQTHKIYRADTKDRGRHKNVGQTHKGRGQKHKSGGGMDT